MSNNNAQNNSAQNSVQPTQKNELRIFIASKGIHSVGTVFNVTENTAKGFHNVYKGSNTEENNTALKALIQTMKETDIEKLSTVCRIFVNQNLYKFLAGGGYKYWLISGKQQNGTAVSQEAMSLLKEFSEIMKEKGEFFIVDNIFNCTISDETKANARRYNRISPYTKQNDYYARYCWDNVEKFDNETVQNNFARVQ